MKLPLLFNQAYSETSISCKIESFLKAKAMFISLYYICLIIRSFFSATLLFLLSSIRLYQITRKVASLCKCFDRNAKVSFPKQKNNSLKLYHPKPLFRIFYLFFKSTCHNLFNHKFSTTQKFKILYLTLRTAFFILQKIVYFSALFA